MAHMNAIQILTLIISGASLIISAIAVTPSMRREHQARQRSRIETDRYAPPWWMCWPYWIGIERHIFRSRIDRTDEWFY